MKFCTSTTPQPQYCSQHDQISTPVSTLAIREFYGPMLCACGPFSFLGRSLRKSRFIDLPKMLYT